MSVHSIVRGLTISLCSLILINCSILKSTEIIQAAWSAGTPEKNYQQGPQACAVLESYLNAKTIPELKSDPFESEAIDPSFVFHGSHASTDTNCAFTDGTMMTWQEMRKKNLSRVCFLPDYAEATLLITPDYSSVKKVLFKSENGKWQIVGQTAYDHVLIDGGYEQAKRGHRTNSYFHCFFA